MGCCSCCCGGCRGGPEHESDGPLSFFCPLLASKAATLAFVGPGLDFETLDEGEDEVEDEAGGRDVR